MSSEEKKKSVVPDGMGESSQAAAEGEVEREGAERETEAEAAREDGGGGGEETATEKPSEDGEEDGGDEAGLPLRTSPPPASEEASPNGGRVKLYVLNTERSWDDKGTGYVVAQPPEPPEPGETLAALLNLVVRAESDAATFLLRSPVLPDTAYQKQQETLIVWSEGESCDLALSFQEKSACDHIWAKICNVQGKDPSVEVTQDVSYEEPSDTDELETSGSGAGSASTGQGLVLPPMDMGHLGDLLDLILSSLPSPMKRESLALRLEADNYLNRLGEVFRMVEDLEDLDSLHTLYQIAKNIFMLNKNALFDILFAEDLLPSVIGMLEYEPPTVGSQASAVSSPRPFVHRNRHRQFLYEKAVFKEVLPLDNPELKAKIHQTFRVQYIQDVILPAPSIFEENMLSSLSSFVFFNKVEIVSIIQEDAPLLSRLFTELTAESTTAEKRRDLAAFLKEYCTFSQTLQQPARDGFFKSLCGQNILSAMSRCLESGDRGTRASATEVLAMVADYSPSLLREHVSDQVRNGAADESLLLNVLIAQMLSDPDPELSGAMQLANIIRIAVDPENMAQTGGPRAEKSDFLGLFYRRCMDFMVRPLVENTKSKERRPLHDDYVRAHRLSLVLEMLAFCLEHHSFHIRQFVVGKGLLWRVGCLLGSRHAFLALGALRFLRKVIGIKDEFYNRHLIKHDVLGSIVEVFLANGSRYNLLNSALLETFDFIRQEDIRSLWLHVGEKHLSRLEAACDYVKTFEQFRTRYEQHLERQRSHTSTPSPNRTRSFSSSRSNDAPTPPLGPRGWSRDDEEETSYFEQDDDWDEDSPRAAASSEPSSPKTPEKEGTESGPASLQRQSSFSGTPRPGSGGRSRSPLDDTVDEDGFLHHRPREEEDDGAGVFSGGSGGGSSGKSQSSAGSAPPLRISIKPIALGGSGDAKDATTQAMAGGSPLTSLVDYDYGDSDSDPEESNTPPTKARKAPPLPPPPLQRRTSSSPPRAQTPPPDPEGPRDWESGPRPSTPPALLPEAPGKRKSSGSPASDPESGEPDPDAPTPPKKAKSIA